MTASRPSLELMPARVSPRVRENGRMFRALLAATLATLVLVTLAPLALAQTAQGYQTGESPHFTFGFAALKAQLGDAMGDPITCEFSDPNGTGDIQQRTSTGLAFWRKSTNTSSSRSARTTCSREPSRRTLRP